MKIVKFTTEDDVYQVGFTAFTFQSVTVHYFLSICNFTFIFLYLFGCFVLSVVLKKCVSLNLH